MSLIGIRAMSVLEEPPMDRMPIQTFVMEYNEEMIREAVLPMAGELLHSVKKLYPDADMVLLAEIMERGIEGYGGYGKSGSRAGV